MRQASGFSDMRLHNLRPLARGRPMPEPGVGVHYALDVVDAEMCRRLTEGLRPRFSAAHDIPTGQKKLSVFHKKYDQHNKRSRQGYDEDLGMTLSRVTKVTRLRDCPCSSNAHPIR